MDKVEWLVLDTIVDGLFFTDVIINCFLAYYTEDNTLEVRGKKIFFHYMRTWMFIDLIACIPF
jgi:potassium voltage-gated channel Eag-related subfamily H protein 6